MAAKMTVRISEEGNGNSENVYPCLKCALVHFQDGKAATTVDGRKGYLVNNELVLRP